jgi:hypothetical protein
MVDVLSAGFCYLFDCLTEKQRFGAAKALMQDALFPASHYCEALGLPQD